jgi:hypothetical protein
MDDPYRPTAWKGSIGQETDWISFGEFELVSGKLLVADPSGPPTDDLLTPELRRLYSVRDHSTIVDLPPGHYMAAARCMQWDDDRRVSRLRVFLHETSVQLGEEIGGVNTDTGVCSVFDVEMISAAWRADPVDTGNFVEYHVTGEEKYGVFTLDEQHRAVMAFAHSGFGGGGFSVHELVSSLGRVGVEVVFIEENKPYPF